MLSCIEHEKGFLTSGPDKPCCGFDPFDGQIACLRGFVNNTGADQPTHTRSLISAFVIRF